MASQLPSQRVKADTFLQKIISRIIQSLENVSSRYFQKTEVMCMVHPLMKHMFEQILLISVSQFNFRGHQIIGVHRRPSIYFRAGRSLNKVKFSAQKMHNLKKLQTCQQSMFAVSHVLRCVGKFDSNAIRLLI